MPMSFPGGKRLKTYKNLTSGVPLNVLPSCPEYIFPLNYPVKAPLEPLVSIDSHVKVGQKIADAENYLAVPVHSSISGIVTDIREITILSGKKTTAIIIENDGQYAKTEALECIPPEKYTTRELLWIIRDAGIAEPDGEPAHIKLTPPGRIKFVIANCAESDLYVTSKQKLIKNYAEDIVKGLKIAMRILNLKEGYIGVETDMHGCFNELKKVLRYDTSIHLLKLKAKYPQSDETQIIKSVTGLDTPVGSVVLDAKTLYDIFRAVNYRESVTKRIVTVSGSAVKSPSVFFAPLGAPISNVLAAAGGLTDEAAYIVTGGKLRGVCADISSPVMKNTDAILALTEQENDVSDKKCLLCRKCVSACPMRINPKLLSNISDISTADDNFILDCSECGLCTYICPKNREPMGKIVKLKAKLK